MTSFDSPLGQPTISLLPKIREEIGEAVPLIVDGGVLRGVVVVGVCGVSVAVVLASTPAPYVEL